MTNKCLWIFVLLEIIQASANSTETLNILLIGSRHDLSKQQISVEKNQIRTDCKQSKISCAVHDVENDDLQNENVGMWTIFPMLNKLKHQKSYWYLVGDDQSHVNILNFVKFVESKNPEEMWFFGFGLHDKEPTIIHHFGFDVPENFLYPLISAGFLLSKGLIENLPTNLKLPNFAIDSKHEFAKLIYNNSGKLMIHEPIHFCAQQQENCVVSWKTIENLKIEEVLNDDVYVMVKTYHGHHQTRIPIIQKTWAKHFKNLFYCSDSEDVNIPTIDMNVGNTERGHCSKTWAIFKKFEKMKKADAWLFIADDDTLVSYQNLMEMLASFNRSQKIIIGERYGYGFSISGSSGFDYPTGGAGMLFSFTAVESILKECPSCGSPDDPDDMMIGACALLANISIFHEPRMHQARPNDYNQIYLRNPITFHKFNDIDPIIAYEKYLNSPLKQVYNSEL